MLKLYKQRLTHKFTTAYVFSESLYGFFKAYCGKLMDNDRSYL